MNTRPLSVTIISWVFIATGCVTFVSGWFPRPSAASAPSASSASVSASTASSAPVAAGRVHGPAEFAMICTTRLLAAVAGVFMLRGQNWARWLALAWIGFHVIVSSLHTPMELLVHVALFAVMAYFLFRPRAAAYFRGTAPAAPTLM